MQLGVALAMLPYLRWTISFDPPLLRILYLCTPNPDTKATALSVLRLPESPNTQTSTLSFLLSSLLNLHLHLHSPFHFHFHLLLLCFSVVCGQLLHFSSLLLDCSCFFQAEGVLLPWFPPPLIHLYLIIIPHYHFVPKYLPVTLTTNSSNSLVFSSRIHSSKSCISFHCDHL